MNKLTKGLVAGAVALMAMGGASQAKVTLSIGGAGCLCYLPTTLAKQLGMYKKAGVDVELIDFKGGSQALTAVIGGSADVVSGYFDHTVELAAKKQKLKSFVVYDRFPGLVLVVAPGQTGKITKVSDLKGKRVGVSAPGSSTDFFLKFELKKAGLAPDAAAVVGVGLGATAIAAMDHGQIDAAVMLEPAVTILQNAHSDLKILVDTRSEADTLKAFGGAYPGGAFYARTDWINSHEKEVQELTNAMVGTLKWIQTHSAEQIMDKMPTAMLGKDKALYLAALKHTMPMFSKDGMMDPKGAEAVLQVFSVGDPAVAKANIDLSQTYTNAFVKKADEK